MERIMSRPHSPFKRSSRPPSRSGSPVRGLSSGHRWGGASAASEQQSTLPTAPSAAFAGPSSSPNGSPTSTDLAHRSSAAATMLRAEHYDVVVEGRHAETILSHLGTIVLDQSTSEQGKDGLARSTSNDNDNMFGARPLSPTKHQRNSPTRAPPNASSVSPDKYDAMLHELMQTEKNYVHRIEVLYQRYAVPLRQMARDRDTAIIPLYEAQRLFGNVGEILGANTAFLHELEQYVSDRFKGKIARDGSGGELGEIVYRNIACFSCYNEYLSNFEKAKHIEQTMMRTNKSFRDFCERTKYSTAGLGNVGLRELIMEPVQRIPRYTLLLNGLIRHLPVADPNRARLEQAVVLASRIASCEVDDKTKRAAVLWSFSRNIDGFPAGLISVHRQYVDCIDVDDFPIDVLGPAAMSTMLSPGAGGGSSTQSYRTLHCTLFLFDDVIVVAKRASSGSCGRTLVGLDNLNKLADQMKTFTERSSSLKSPTKVELGFRGLIDVADVGAVDMGGLDFQLLFKRPPTHTTGDKWAGRPVRQYATVDAQSDQGPDPAMAREEKQRFLENIWKTQALHKARDHKSHVRSSVVLSPDQGTQRLIYWNVYGRHPYLMSLNKSDIVLHVDPDGEADDLPLGHDDMPAHASLRILTMDDETAYCTYMTALKHDAAKASLPDAGEVHHVPLVNLPDELYRTVKALQRTPLDFGPRQHSSPSPRSPSSSHRGKALASGLEQFGRSLFGTPGSLRSNAAGSDFWGGVRRQRSKGSSQFTRNPSTSTRQTYSTAQTSSIGSRDMMARSGAQLGASISGELQANIERYRNASPGREEATAAANAMTPTGKSDMSYSPDNMTREGAVSPIRRKPVPSSGTPMTEMSDRSPPRRVHSGSTKRELPADATPTAKPSKRAAPSPSSSSRVRGELFDDRDAAGAARFASSSGTPPSPSPITPKRNQSARSTASSSLVVAPLSIRKDKGQARLAFSREDVLRKARRDVDSLQQTIIDTQRSVQRARRQDTDAGALEDCLADLSSTKHVLQRLRQAFDTLASHTMTENEEKMSADGNAASASTHEAIAKLQTQVTTLTRKCELLVSLEQDGRLENTELHKAFNEELDRLYDDAQLSDVEQIARLRAEVRRAKSERNEAFVERKALQRQLALERAQSEVWRATLEKNRLI